MNENNDEYDCKTFVDDIELLDLFSVVYNTYDLVWISNLQLLYKCSLFENTG